MSSDELVMHGLEDTRELYDEVLDVYNHVHGRRLIALHRHHEESEAMALPFRTTTALGAAGLTSLEGLG